MNESQLRTKVVNVMQGWLGWSEANGKYKKIIDLYNTQRPLPRSYPVKYSDEWCATTVTAAGMQAGLHDIIYGECSCGKMVALYQAAGRWQESDSYRPHPGDIIMYDWEDSGNGDNTGAPNHVGIVEKVVGNTITVIEGNKGGAVARRTLSVNGRYIRGYCLPDYSSKAEGDDDMTEEQVRAIVRDEYNKIESEQAALPADTWAEAGMKEAEAKGITDGSRPKAKATRQEVALMVNAVSKG